MLVVHDWKVAPDRVIRYERVALQCFCEYLFAECSCFRSTQLRETRSRKRFLIDFDNERAELGRIPVVVRVEKSQVIPDKSLGERLKAPGCSEPGKMICQKFCAGAKLFLMGPPYDRVNAIGANDEIRSGETIDFVNDAPKNRFDANRAGTGLQYLQQTEPTDGGKPNAIDSDTFSAVHESDIRPRFHVGSDRRIGGLVVLAQKFQCAVGEHDAKAERGIGAILLHDSDVPIRTTAFDQICKIQSRRAGAENADTHGAAILQSAACRTRYRTAVLYARSAKTSALISHRQTPISFSSRSLSECNSAAARCRTRRARRSSCQSTVVPTSLRKKPAIPASISCSACLRAA